jgi:fructose 1,6-bisphosphate aldolase/phosphatase
VAKRVQVAWSRPGLLSDAFSGNIKGMGPGVAEMEIDNEREAESVLIFMRNKTSSGAWNMLFTRFLLIPFQH